MTDPSIETNLPDLDRQLGRLRRRAARLHRGVEKDTARWPEWSNTLEDAFGLVDQMTSIPAQGLDDIAIKIGAVVWFPHETDAVLDARGMRQLRALALEARRLAQR